MITWAELGFFVLGLILGGSVLAAWHFQDASTFRPSRTTPNRDLLLQRLKALKRGRLFTITDLPVPDDYRGVKTDDVLNLVSEINGKEAR